MTSSEREQLVWFLVEAEVEEGRVSDFFRGPKVVDPEAVMGMPRQAGVGQVVTRGVPGYQRALHGVRGRALQGGRAVRDVIPTGGHVAWAGRQALGKAKGAAGSAGSFISKGARGYGLQDLRKAAQMARYEKMGAMSPGFASALSGGGRALGRSAAVYGGAAALTAGGALGARALYRRHKARKAQKEQE